MELLLNLLWSTLVLLAVALWWRKTTPAQDRYRLGRRDQLVLLGCVLILLFPIVSATDDLHPLRQEMEESSPSKRLKQGASGRCSTNLSLDHTSALYPTHFPSTVPIRQIADEIVLRHTLFPKIDQLSTDPCRAPPISVLS